MVGLATKIIERRGRHFDPARFDDRYQAALAKLVTAKMEGETPVAPAEAKAGPAVDLMAALKRSLQQAAESASPRSQPRRKAAPRKTPARKKTAAKPARRRA